MTEAAGKIEIESEELDDLPPPPSYEAPFFREGQSQRSKIAHEIVSSEKSYFDSLTLLKEEYVDGIIEAELLSVGTRRELSAAVCGILELQKTLLSDLNECIQEWDDESSLIGDKFVKLGPFFSMYNTYCGNYQDTIAIINEKMNNQSSSFAQFTTAVAERMRAKDVRLDLPSLLIMPVQRIPRYRLLLKELLSETDEAHVDHAALTTALELMTRVADEVNESVAERANRNKLMSITRELRAVGPQVVILAPGRKFVREGELKKLCRKSIKRRRLWLFNDMLLYATPNDMPGTRISTRPVLLSLRGARVAEVPPSSGAEALADSTPFALQIATPTKSFIAYADSQQERSA